MRSALDVALDHHMNLENRDCIEIISNGVQFFCCLYAFCVRL